MPACGTTSTNWTACPPMAAWAATIKPPIAQSRRIGADRSVRICNIGVIRGPSGLRRLEPFRRVGLALAVCPPPGGDVGAAELAVNARHGGCEPRRDLELRDRPRGVAPLEQRRA